MSFFNLPFGIRVSNAEPVDGDRYLVTNDAARDLLVTTGRAFVGLQIYHQLDGKLYYCSSLGLTPSTTTWTEIGSGSSGGSSSSFNAVNDIAARNALIAVQGMSCFVRNSSADPIIATSIWAYYIYDLGSWVLLVRQTADALGQHDLSTASTTGNYASTGISITAKPRSHVSVYVNGLLSSIGYGNRVKDCYFSSDGGTTSKALNAIVSGDVLYWNGTIAGYQLDTSDKLDLQYEV